MTDAVPVFNPIDQRYSMGDGFAASRLPRHVSAGSDPRTEPLRVPSEGCPLDRPAGRRRGLPRRVAPPAAATQAAFEAHDSSSNSSGIPKKSRFAVCAPVCSGNSPCYETKTEPLTYRATEEHPPVPQIPRKSRQKPDTVSSRMSPKEPLPNFLTHSKRTIVHGD